MKRALVSAALAFALAAPAAFAQPDRHDPAGRHMAGMPDRAHAMHHHRRHASLAPGMGLLGVGPGPTDHVEGRIAFLRAELGVTAAQSAAWDAFAEAMRANAKRTAPARQDDDGALARLEAAEQRLADRLEGVRSTRAALAALQPQLDEKQRQTLDELLSPPRRPDRRR